MGGLKDGVCRVDVECDFSSHRTPVHQRVVSVCVFQKQSKELCVKSALVYFAYAKKLQVIKIKIRTVSKKSLFQELLCFGQNLILILLQNIYKVDRQIKMQFFTDIMMMMICLNCNQRLVLLLNLLWRVLSIHTDPYQALKITCTKTNKDNFRK